MDSGALRQQPSEKRKPLPCSTLEVLSNTFLCMELSNIQEDKSGPTHYEVVYCSRLIGLDKGELTEHLCLRTSSHIYMGECRGEIWTRISHFTSWDQNTIGIYSQCVDNSIVTREVLNEISIWEFPLLNIIWRTRCKRVTERKQAQYIKVQNSCRDSKCPSLKLLLNASCKVT